MQRRGMTKKALTALKYDGKDVDDLKKENTVLAMEVESITESPEKQEEMKGYTKRILELQEHDKEHIKKTDHLEKKESFNAQRHQQQRNINILTQQNPSSTMCEVGDSSRDLSFQSRSDVSQDCIHAKAQAMIIEMAREENRAICKEIDYESIRLPPHDSGISIRNDDSELHLPKSRMKMPVIVDIENDER